RARLCRGAGRGRHDHPLPRPARHRPGALGAGGRGPLRGRAHRLRPVHPARAAVRTAAAVPGGTTIRPVRSHRGAPMTPTSSPENDLTALEGDPSDAASGEVTPVEGTQPLPADIAELSYESARDQLVE